MTEIQGTLTPRRFKEIWDTAQTLTVADFNLTEIISPHVLEERILRARQYAEQTLALMSEVRKSQLALTTALNNRKNLYNRLKDDLLVNEKAVYELKPVARVEAALNLRLQEHVDAMADLEHELADLKVLMTELENRKSELTTTGQSFRVAKESMQFRMSLEFTGKTGLPAPVVSGASKTSRLARQTEPNEDLSKLVDANDYDDDDYEDVTDTLKLSPLNHVSMNGRTHRAPSMEAN